MIAAPTTQEIFHKLTRARAALIIDQPFFGNLALRLELKLMSEQMTAAFVARGQRPTLAVDGRNIFFDPAFIDSLDIDLVKSALAHEVGHCVFNHIGRRGSRDPRKWNMAGDYVINDVIKDAGFRLGDGWLINPAFKNMSADEIYNLLPDQDGDGPGEGPGPLDEILSGPADEDQDIASNDWKIATIQAATAAKEAGKLPASLQRFVEELVTPKVDWRAQLRRFLTERTKDDYSWMRPNRRLASMGLFLPSLYSEAMGTMVIVTDDSGSIGDDILQAFASEIADIRNGLRPLETIVISCDAEVNHVDRLQPNDPFKLECHGGGGTDFRPPFAWLEKEGVRPVCLVYLTDLYGPVGEDPGFPVMWCCTTDQKAPWGETIKLEV